MYPILLSNCILFHCMDNHDFIFYPRYICAWLNKAIANNTQELIMKKSNSLS